MSSAAVPALRRGLAVLTLLAGRPSAVSAAGIARDLDLPRSTVYDLLAELRAAGFVVHLPQSRRWGLGVAAFELGSAYLRGEPLQRLGEPVLRRLAARSGDIRGIVGATAHLGVLHGAQTLYLLKERAGGGPTLITDVGVRLPATLTATGLSMLAALPAAQVRALLPDAAAFVLRTGVGPATLPQLRADLAATRARGWAVEHGRVSQDTASVACCVFDHASRPLAAVGLTIRHVCADAGCDNTFAELAAAVRQAATALTTAIGGSPPG